MLNAKQIDHFYKVITRIRERGIPRYVEPIHKPLEERVRIVNTMDVKVVDESKFVNLVGRVLDGKRWLDAT